MDQSFAILGSNPSLSFAEVFWVLGGNPALFDVCGSGCVIVSDPLFGAEAPHLLGGVPKSGVIVA
ncbi:MAG: hypothetical protein U1C18_03110, partial [Patescibacteria group bacterium]|nr:hypothetical protein [Patescibacteria group bacterium]